MPWPQKVESTCSPAPFAILLVRQRDGIGYLAEFDSWPADVHRLQQTSLGCSDEQVNLRSNLPETDHRRGVAEEAVFEESEVEIDPVALNELPLGRHAVGEDVVCGDADAVREAHEPHARGVGALSDNELTDTLIHF